MTNLDIMKQIEAFKGLDEYQLNHILSYCKESEYKQGERLFTEGDDATDLWIMIDGELEMRFDLPGRPTSKANNIATITKFQAFGWSCFVPPNKYTLSAYCSTDTCKVIKIEKAGLESLFEKDNCIGFTLMSYLVKVVGLRFHQFQDEVTKHRGEDIISGW